MSSSEQYHPVSVAQKPRIIYAGEPKDYTLWDNNQDTLRRLYLAQNSSLKDVKRRMETEHQFPVLPLKEYETVLRDHFQFRKKVGRSDWGPIGYRIEKRRLAGKNSKVYLGPKLLPPHSVAREVRRYNTKDKILSRIHQGLSPRLPENIIIRTPSPQLTQHVETMSLDHTLNTYGSNLAKNTFEYANRVSRDFLILDITAMADQYTRIEAINAIRLRSPFNGFLTLLQTLTSPTPADRLSGTGSGPSSYSAIVETATSSHTTQLPPPRFQTESLGALFIPNVELLSDPSRLVFPGRSILPAMLAHACFEVSNWNDWPLTFTKDLLEWVESSAEPADLKNFFSIESYTVTAIWENLVDFSMLLERKVAFQLLIDSALSMGRDKWIMRRPAEILYRSVGFGMFQIVQRLLALEIPPGSRVSGEHYSYPDTPLNMAAQTLQPDMINILFHYGANVNLLIDDDELWVHSPLFSLILGAEIKVEQAEDGEEAAKADDIIECARILLDRGLQVDVCRIKRHSYSPPPSLETEDTRLLVKEWFHPEEPRWCTDYAWLKLGCNHQLVHTLTERSSRARSHLTVPGIITQARKGLKNLESYLGERRFPLESQNRTALLEVALYWATELDHLDAVTCLLQFGVDPNVGTISRFLEHNVVDFWQPVCRASQWRNDGLVSILRNYGAIITIYDIIESALKYSDHDRLHSMGLSDGDIETHGIQLLGLFLSHADHRNFSICASMCDFLWFKNVPQNIKWTGGRDSLHFAIWNNCCVEMCEFLVARGYEVHSYPSESTHGAFYCSTMLGDAIAEFAYSTKKKCTKVIDFLVEQGASLEFPPEGRTLLELVLDPTNKPGSFQSEKRELFERFMALGASVNGTLTRQSVLCKLIKLEADDNILFRVINASEDVDQQGEPLAMALRYGRMAVAENLLSRGAKVNHPPCKSSPGVLAAACSQISSSGVQYDANTHIRFIERLLNLGADVNGSAETALGGSIPLQNAASTGLIEVACLLMKHGADVNARCQESMSALDYAAEQGRLDMVQLLRGAGGISGDPGETGVDGAIRLAEKKRHYSVSDFLRSTIDRSDMEEF
ncbi:hypothetical protein G7054_g14977 [Neopestalotiopsis clavispora]|nr:hypothetical protein G7054_g14977 [Neopestalotiopsis clavispora]